MTRSRLLTLCVILMALLGIAAGLLAQSGKYWAGGGFAFAALVFLSVAFFVYHAPQKSMALSSHRD